MCLHISEGKRIDIKGTALLKPQLKHFLPHFPHQGWPQEGEVNLPGLDQGEHERPPAQNVGLHVAGCTAVGHLSRTYTHTHTHAHVRRQHKVNQSSCG